MTCLIVFSPRRWSFVYQRPEYLMSRLARHYRVLFIEAPVRGHGAARLDAVPEGPNLDVLVPHTSVAAGGFHDDPLRVLAPLLATYLRDHGISDPVVWFYTPMALPLLDALAPRLVVYDCIGELASL